MNITKTVNDPFELRQMIIQFANAETIERDVISLTFIFKNRGHNVAAYTEEQLEKIWSELTDMDYKTKQQKALMRVIQERILEANYR